MVRSQYITIVVTLPPPKGGKVLWWVFICLLFVCLLFACLYVSSHNSKTTRPNFTDLYACCLWPWLGFSLTALRHIATSRLCMASSFYTMGPVGQNQARRYIWKKFVRWRYLLDTVFDAVHQNEAPGAKSDIYDCFVCYWHYVCRLLNTSFRRFSPRRQNTLHWWDWGVKFEACESPLSNFHPPPGSGVELWDPTKVNCRDSYL